MNWQDGLRKKTFNFLPSRLKLEDNPCCQTVLKSLPEWYPPDISRLQKTRGLGAPLEHKYCINLQGAGVRKPRCSTRTKKKDEPLKLNNKHKHWPVGEDRGQSGPSEAYQRLTPVATTPADVVPTLGNDCRSWATLVQTLTILDNTRFSCHFKADPTTANGCSGSTYSEAIHCKPKYGPNAGLVLGQCRKTLKQHWSSIVSISCVCKE